METRLDRLRAQMASQGIDVLLVRHVPDIHWLTGFPRVFDSEMAHWALVSAQRAWIHTDSRYSSALRQRDADSAAPGTWLVDDEVVKPYEWVVSTLREAGLVGETGRICTLGIEDDLPLNHYRALRKALDAQGIEVCDDGQPCDGQPCDGQPCDDAQPCDGARPDDGRPDDGQSDGTRPGGANAAACALVLKETPSLVLGLRQVKDRCEIDLMQAAQDITDRSFAELLDLIAPGMTEKQVAFELETLLRRNGADALSFATIVASGPNGANPHSVPGDRALQQGDLVVMDFGIVLDGYCSDMTRTICIGCPSDEQRRVYDTVLAANRACNEVIRPGVALADIHKLASDIIDEAGYPGTFRHALGHGVGLEVHEQPCFSPRSAGQAQVGNVVTVEPGIYLEGRFGVRIENYGVVTEQGFRSFTHSPDDLICVPV